MTDHTPDAEPIGENRTHAAALEVLAHASEVLPYQLALSLQVVGGEAVRQAARAADGVIGWGHVTFAGRRAPLYHELIELVYNAPDAAVAEAIAVLKANQLPSSTQRIAEGYAITFGSAGPVVGQSGGVA